MRWDRDHDSPDVVDERSERAGVGISPFLIALLLRTRFGWVILLVLVLGSVAFRFLGADDGTASRAHGGAGTVSEGDPDATMVHFVAFVLDDTQAVWTHVFEARGETYRHAKLVLFRDRTSTGCGYGDAATGPFYCPSDERVYIDLSFFHELSTRFGAGGEFARAYVVAHEIGHHVQKLLGSEAGGRRLRGAPQEGAGGTSVRIELQADCYAGLWAHATQERQLLEAGDIDAALTAAAAIGDDRLQRQSTGTVSPESWTHGSSAQRSRWFKRGFERGTIEACDTFAANPL